MEGSLRIETLTETGISPELHRQAEARTIGRKEIINAGSSKAVDICNRANLKVTGHSPHIYEIWSFAHVIIFSFEPRIACQSGLEAVTMLPNDTARLEIRDMDSMLSRTSLCLC